MAERGGGTKEQDTALLVFIGQKEVLSLNRKLCLCSGREVSRQSIWQKLQIGFGITLPYVHIPTLILTVHLPQAVS